MANYFSTETLQNRGFVTINFSFVYNHLIFYTAAPDYSYYGCWDAPGFVDAADIRVKPPGPRRTIENCLKFCYSIEAPFAGIKTFIRYKNGFFENHDCIIMATFSAFCIKTHRNEAPINNKKRVKDIKLS